MKGIVRGAGLVPVLLLALGCGGKPDGTPPAVSTGAAEAAKSYFEALVEKDWAGAYQALDSDSKARCTRDQFAQLAERQMRATGFEPTETTLQSCDEHNDEAIAHVTLKGRTGTSLKFRKDTVALRRRGTTWAVVLPANFGTARPAKG